MARYEHTLQFTMINSFESSQCLDLADVGATVIEYDAGLYGDADSDREFSRLCFTEDCGRAIDSLDWAFDCYGAE